MGTSLAWVSTFYPKVNDKKNIYLDIRIGAKPTILGDHSERDHVAGLLDELDDVIVRELQDGAAVDGWDAVADV